MIVHKSSPRSTRWLIDLYENGRTTREIAAELGLSQSTVTYWTKKLGYDSNRRYRNKFWRKVYRRTEGCWEWQALRHRQGYGEVQYNGEMEYAHRVAWMIASGKSIPHGLHVLHKCNNPPCVRPDHLKLGTHAENLADAARDGLFRVKVSASDVQEMRQLRQSGCTVRSIAKRYSLNAAYAGQVINRNERRHV